MFKITCLKCGKEVEIKSELFIYSEDMEGIVVEAGIGSGVWIECSCNNILEIR